MAEIKVGDHIFSKNNMEFGCSVKAINGSKITVEYVDDYEETQVVDKSCIAYKKNGLWEAPNWTFQFEQL